MIAFLAIVARGVVFHGNITLTFQMATLGLFSFGILGYTIGRIAEMVIEDSIREKILSEFTEETRQYYLEQSEQLKKQGEEDQENLLRIQKLLDLHRSLFMRFVHLEISKGLDKKISEQISQN